MQKVSSRPALAVLAACILLVGFTLLNYNITWQHVEFFTFITPAAFRNGADLKLSDLPRAFDWIAFDGYERARFLSNLLNLASVKLRFWMSDFLPPHPSISLAWPLLLIVAPVCLYKAVLHLSKDKSVALITTALFFVAPGTLSGLTMLFHAGKPLVLTFATMTLYLLSLADARRERGEAIGIRDWVLAGAMFIAGFFAMNSDESGAIFLIVAWAFFPHLLRTRRGMLLCGAAAACFVVFALWLFVGAPIVVKALGYGYFDFVAASARLHSTERGQLPSMFAHPFHYAWNAYVFLAEMLVPGNNLLSFQILHDSAYRTWLTESASVPHAYPLQPATYVGAMGAAAGAAIGAIIFSLVILASRVINHQRRMLLLGATAAHLACSVALTVLNNHALIGSFYYGNIAAIPLAIGLAAALAPASGSHWKWRMLLITLVLAVTAWNSISSNMIWRQMLGEQRPTRFKEAYAAWRNQTPSESLGSWRWLSAHQKYSHSIPLLRSTDTQVGIWLAGFSTEPRPEASFILSEMKEGLRIGFLNILVDSPIYDRGRDLADKLKETCNVCIKISDGTIERISVRGVDLDRHPLPIELQKFAE